MGINILVCDDDKEIVGAIEIYLLNEGYSVYKAYNGAEALDCVKNHDIHLIIIDVMMPVMDGLRATIKIREQKNIPIIILSAKSEYSDKVLGLNLGADDYVSKPFNPLELIARVKSQVRRLVSSGDFAEGAKELSSGGLVLDDDIKKVTVDGEAVNLTPIEYNIIKFLLENKGKVFSTNQIYENIWNEPMFSSENTVAVHIRHIREKIEINPKDPKYLKVVWGIGYKIEKL